MNKPRANASDEPGKVRLDKWLWAARFYKTRGLSSEEIDRGRVTVNGQLCKPSRDVRIGDYIAMRSGHVTRTVIVQGLSGVRGPAPVAALLYCETTESIAAREAAAEQRRLAPEPALALTQGRPSKKDRRTMDQWRNGQASPSPGNWNARWSASVDD
ncbi:MAG: S4 domain-containing protein [Burkholderiaceae bacterium]